MSPGSRSGVNWMRWNGSASSRARPCTSSVLPRPGRPSSSTWPRASTARTTRSMTGPWSISTWLRPFFSWAAISAGPWHLGGAQQARTRGSSRRSLSSKYRFTSARLRGSSAPWSTPASRRPARPCPLAAGRRPRDALGCGFAAFRPHSSLASPPWPSRQRLELQAVGIHLRLASEDERVAPLPARDASALALRTMAADVIARCPHPGPRLPPRHLPLRPVPDPGPSSWREAPPPVRTGGGVFACWPELPWPKRSSSSAASAPMSGGDPEI